MPRKSVLPAEKTSHSHGTVFQYRNNITNRFGENFWSRQSKIYIIFWQKRLNKLDFQKWRPPPKRVFLHDLVTEHHMKVVFLWGAIGQFFANPTDLVKVTQPCLTQTLNISLLLADFLFIFQKLLVVSYLFPWREVLNHFFISSLLFEN